MIGTKFAHYEITAHLGSGGMGDVYQATDSKLGCSVAIKFLPEAFSHNTERVARFQREARVLASLNHTNIAGIYGVEEVNGRHFLAMELVTGETLADRIKRGAIPIEEVLPIAKQIAEALEEAHEKGIIHRDLKPANIKITPDGRVKVLDFGLAKAYETERASVALSNSPTMISMAATNAGVILGTAAYMSPEQAKGKEVDKRADIWAFGVVLYEMLTGKMLFFGETVSETMAFVMTKEPDWDALPDGVPLSLQTCLRRCLQKDPKQRIRDIGDVRLALEGAFEAAAPQMTAVPSATARGRLPWTVAVLAVLAAVAVATIGYYRRDPLVSQPPMKLNIDLGAAISPASGAFEGPTLAISPDSSRLVFASPGSNGKGHLVLKTLATSQLTVLPGTDGAASPFFSPDGRWIAFFADSKLKKVSIEGGDPLTLAEARNPRGGFWGEDGYILFAPENRVGLFRIPASGGSPRATTQLDIKQGEVSNRFPQLLPGGKAILFSTRTAQENWDEGSIVVQISKTGEHKTLVHGGYYGHYLPNGYLVYVHQGTLYAATMDVGRLEVTGTPAPVLENLKNFVGNAWAYLGLSESGNLVYLADAPNGEQLPFMFDAAGAVERVPATPRQYSSVLPSPDGTQLALIAVDGSGCDLFIYDLARKRESRVAEFKESVDQVIWANDGKHLVIRTPANQLSGPGIYWLRADGGGEPQRLIQGADWIPASFSTDGKRLGYYHRTPPYGLWALPLNLADPEHPQPGSAESLFQSPFDVRGPTFSPDGRWISYRSNESGRAETYVRALRGSGGQWRMSVDGGGWGFWSLRKNEFFYPTPDKIYFSEYSVNGDSFVPGQSRVWADKVTFFSAMGTAGGLMPDDAHYVALLPTSASTTVGQNTHAVLLINFSELLRHQK